MCKQRLILRLAGAPIKPRFHFGQHDERNPNFVTRAKKRRERGISLEQVDQPVRVESNPHFHLSASILRWEAMTLSNPGSGTHLPTRSEKSVFTGFPMRARVNSSRTTRFRLRSDERR